MAETMQRIQIIDIVRGVAVLGILSINLPDMAYPQDLVLDFPATDPGKGWDYWTGMGSEILVAGKMRGLFTLLFGVSSILIVERFKVRFDGLTAADLYFRRLLWLLVFGLFNAYVLLWWGDVLFKYALLGMLLFAFRGASLRLLTGAALSCLIVLTVQPVTDYVETAKLEQRFNALQAEPPSAQPLTADTEEVLERWQDKLDDLRADEEAVEDEQHHKTGGYRETFSYNAGLTLVEYTTILYQEDLWDIGLYMLLGMLLLRIGFFADRVSQSSHLLAALFGIGTGLAIHTWMNLGFYANHLDPLESRYYLIFWDLGRLPFVIGYLSLIILVFRMAVFSRAGDWMAAVGRMSLSNYMAQSAIAAIIFYGIGFSQFNQLNRVELVAVMIAIWIVQIVISVFWMKRFQYGPLEWLWRSLTYWKPQPLWKNTTGT